MASSEREWTINTLHKFEIQELRRMVTIAKRNGRPHRFTLGAMTVLHLLGLAKTTNDTIGYSGVMFVDEASDNIYWGNVPLFEGIGKRLIAFILDNIEPLDNLIAYNTKPKYVVPPFMFIERWWEQY